MVRALRKSHRVSTEVAATLTKINFIVELVVSIYFELWSRAIVIILQVVSIVLPACTTSVTLAVESFTTRWATRMRRCLSSPLVCLHYVKLRAVVTSYLVCITIVVTIRVPVSTILLLPRHAHKIKCCNTTTVPCAQVYIVLYTSPEKIWLKEFCWVKWCRLWKITSLAVRNSDCGAWRLVWVDGHIKSLTYSINFCSNGRPSIRLWL